MEEMIQNRKLQIYGALLSLAHLLCALYWLATQVPLWMSSTEPICWPLLRACENLPRFSLHFWTVALFVFGGLSILNALLFFFRRIRSAYVLHIFLNLARVGFVFLDYRLRLNQHIILSYIEIVFLFLPFKTINLRVLIALTYFAASWLKFSPEWLTGAVFPHSISWIAPQKLEWLMAYVVLLESVIVFGLFSNKRWLFITSFLQLTLFHLASVFVVGFFYPALMMLALSIYLLDQNPIRINRLTASAAVTFLMLQAIPHLQSGDPALTGAGRAYAVHMFDANVSCETVATYQFDDHSLQSSLAIDFAPFRIHCDPAAYLSKARQLCTKFKGDTHFKGISLSMLARRQTDPYYTHVVQEENVCVGMLDSSLP
jgi:hypothetical protein